MKLQGTKVPTKPSQPTQLPKRRAPNTTAASLGLLSRVSTAIFDAVSHVPKSTEPENSDPGARAQELLRKAANGAAKVSGGAALVPGPLGILTLLVDLFGVWRLQIQLVADIAAAHGKTGSLNPALMLYCLFKHTASHVVRDLVVRAGERFLVRRATLQVLKAVAAKLGIKVTQRILGKSIARFLPIVGAAAVGGYAYYDTRQVGKTALELFSQDIVVEPADGLALEGAS